MGGAREGNEPKGNSESDIVNVAIKQLVPKIRDRLMKLFAEGLLKDNDLDLRSITVFASLNEGLQDRVMTHMENERIYVANARSKSGFLIATCDKAKTGCLDARGLGAIDPWRSALVAMATPKQKILELLSEQDWLDKNPDTVKFEVSVGAAQKELGMQTVTVEVPLSDTTAAIKNKLSQLGIKSIPENQMKLHADTVGFLNNRFTLAYYNLKDGAHIELSVRKRAGSRFREDHAVPLKRPKTLDRQHTPVEKPEAKLPAMPALPGLPGLPAAAKLPGMPSLPGLPGLPQLPGGAGMTLPGLGKAAGLPGMLSLPGMPAGFPGMPGLPGLGVQSAVRGPAPPALDPAFLAKLGLGMPGLLGGAAKAPGMPGMLGIPGLASTGASAKASMMMGMSS